jgi:hypothetical protein
MKHTPGPWHRGDGEHWCREIRGHDGTGVAWCGHFPFDADARLIAAAPKMLKTLKHLAANCLKMRAFEHDVRQVIGNTNWQVLDDYVSEAYVVIAEAEGKS